LVGLLAVNPPGTALAQDEDGVIKIEERVEFIRRMHKNVLVKISLKKS